MTTTTRALLAALTSAALLVSAGAGADDAFPRLFDDYRRAFGPRPGKPHMIQCDQHIHNLVNAARAANVDLSDALVLRLGKGGRETRLTVNRAAFDPEAFGRDRMGRPGTNKFAYHVALLVPGADGGTVFDPLLKGRGRVAPLEAYLETLMRGVARADSERIRIDARPAASFLSRKGARGKVDRPEAGRRDSTPMDGGWRSFSAETRRRYRVRHGPFDPGSRRYNRERWWGLRAALPRVLRPPELRHRFKQLVRSHARPRP